MSAELRFRAVLPPDAQMPVKPTKDAGEMCDQHEVAPNICLCNGPTTLVRRVRVWFDAWFRPGQTETLLLHSEDELDVVVSRRPKQYFGPVSRIGPPQEPE